MKKYAGIANIKANAYNANGYRQEETAKIPARATKSTPPNEMNVPCKPNIVLRSSP